MRCLHGISRLFIWFEQYLFELTVSKDTRVSVSSAQLRVSVSASPLPLPAVSISLSVPTQGSRWTVINTRDRVELLAISTAVLANMSSSSSPFLWSWRCMSGSLDLTQAALLTTDTTSPMLGIAAHVLRPGIGYTFAVRLSLVTAAVAAAAVQFTEASVSFTVASTPTGGRYDAVGLVKTVGFCDLFCRTVVLYRLLRVQPCRLCFSSTARAGRTRLLVFSRTALQYAADLVSSFSC